MLLYNYSELHINRTNLFCKILRLYFQILIHSIRNIQSCIVVGVNNESWN